MTLWYDEIDDDGTMPANVASLAEAVVGHRIVEVEHNAQRNGDWDYWSSGIGTRLKLDDGTSVFLSDTSDCCAFTELNAIVEHLPSIDHIITSVVSDEDYNTWHVLADFGEVMELKVSWSAGNPFYYGYGLNIQVEK